MGHFDQHLSQVKEIDIKEDNRKTGKQVRTITRNKALNFNSFDATQSPEERPYLKHSTLHSRKMK